MDYMTAYRQHVIMQNQIGINYFRMVVMSMDIMFLTYITRMAA